MPTDEIANDFITPSHFVGVTAATGGNAGLVANADVLSHVTFLQAGTGAVARALSDVVTESAVNVMNFGALGDGSGAKYTEWFTGGAHDLGIGATTAADINTYFGLSGSFSSITDQNCTIDFIAHYAAWKYGVSNGLPIYSPPGTYIIGEMFRLFASDNFHWFGAGPSTIIKREAGVVTSTGRVALLDFNVTNGQTIDVVRVENMFLDGNARENPPAWSANQAISVGDFRRNKDATTTLDMLYQCVTAGTTAGSGGPQGTGAAITDGTAVWDYINEVRKYTLWEQKPLLRVAPQGTAFARIRTAVFQDLWMTDPIGDGILLPWQHHEFSAAGVDLAVFENVQAWNRNRSRGDIIWFSSVRNIYINNCNVPKIETEMERPTRNERAFITNTQANTIDMDGATNGNENFSVYMNNVQCERFQAGEGQYHIANSDIGVRSRFTNTGTLKIINSKMRLEIGNSQEVLPLKMWEFVSDDRQHWQLHQVHFDWNVRRIQDVTSANELPMPESQRFVWNQRPYAYNAGTETFWLWDSETFAWVDLETTELALAAPAAFMASTNALIVDKRKWILEIENCTFREGFDYNLVVESIGTVKSRNNTFNADVAAIKIQRTLSNSACALESLDDDFKAAAAPLAIGESRATSIGLLWIAHSKASEWAPGWVSEHANAVDMTIVSERRFQVAAAPTGGGLVGDKAQLAPLPASGSPYEWLCTVSHPTAATWVASKWAAEETATTVSAATGNVTLVTAAAFGLRYAVKIEETTAMDGDPKTFRLGTSAGDDSILGDVTATGTAEAIVYVDGAGQDIVLSWVNTAGAAGVLTATVKVMG